MKVKVQLNEWAQEVELRLDGHDRRLAALEQLQWHYHGPVNQQPGPDIATPADWRQVREDIEQLQRIFAYSLPQVARPLFARILERILETARKFEGGK